MISKLKNTIKKRAIRFIKGHTGDIPTEDLIKMGLTVGKNFTRLHGCIIDHTHCWLITIGDNVTLAPRVHILAHDTSTEQLGYTKIALVDIGNNVFVGASSIILPNVKIGDNVIIGAGSVVTKNIPSGSVAIGNPARVVGETAKLLDKNKVLMKTRPVYDKAWTVRCGITDDQKTQMKKALEDGAGFVE